MIDLKDEVQQADEAFALDWYKDNGYTDIGSAVCDIKYGYIKNDTLSVERLNELINYLVGQLKPFVKGCDIILPIPSFNPRHKNNPSGELKVMYMIADRLGEVSGKNVEFTILQKTSSNQAKDSQLTANDYTSKTLPDDIKNVLLIDDLFGEGNTANYTVSALRQMNPDIFIRFISLTKNKYGGIHKDYDCRISQYNPYKAYSSGIESIDLYFYKNNKSERVKIWSDHSRFQEVKRAFDIEDYNKIFEFSIYKKDNGYWQITDD